MKSERCAKILLENKYLDACFNGDIDTVEYMIKKEYKTLKSNKFLEKCLNKACDGDHLEVCKIILGYRSLQCIASVSSFTAYDTVAHAFMAGRFNIAVFYFTVYPDEKCNHQYMAMLNHSCMSNNTDLVKYMLQMVSKYECGHEITKIDVHCCLTNACLAGNFDTVKLFSHYDGINCHHIIWDNYLHLACTGGNLEIVKFLIQQGASNFDNWWDWGVGDNVDMINFLLERSEIKLVDFGIVLASACGSGHFRILNLFASKIDNINIEKCMISACVNGHLKIVEFLINLGATHLNNWNNYADYARSRSGDNCDIIELLVERGASNFNEYLKYACGHGRIGFVKILMEKGATNFNEGLIKACMYDYIDLVQLMIKHGATNFNDCLQICCCWTATKNVDICNILILSGATDLHCLIYTDDFKLYCTWLKSYRSTLVYSGNTWMDLVTEYPPCMLLVWSRLSKNNKCAVKRLPVELFTLLVEY